jgi:hypothetical protein
MKEFASYEDSVKSISENVYYYRRARYIGPKSPCKRDRDMAKRFLHDYAKDDTINLYDWCMAEFKKR